MDIITGQTGVPHVTSQQDREINMALFGYGNVVLPIGEQFRYEMPNSNTLRIFDGMLSMQGCIASIAAGGYDDVIIESGVSGSVRKDLVCAKYEKSIETSYESVTLTVIQGDAALPSVDVGDIRNGSLTAYFPLFEVTVDGLSDVTVKVIFNVTDLNLSQNEKLLWTGNYAMNSGTVITLPEKISAQAHGLKIVFAGGKKDDWNYDIQIADVDKLAVRLLSGHGFSFPLFGAGFGNIGLKYLYITDDKITGNAVNVQGGTKNGITYQADYVIKAVIGY